jgi:hypothetical protein
MDGSPIQRKTRSTRYKLGLTEHYLTENKIHPSQMMTRLTLFNQDQDPSVTNYDSLNPI